jgi:hypoxanthine phosphoribosyltransferase
MTAKIIQSQSKIRHQLSIMSDDLNERYKGKEVEIVLINTTPIFFINDLLAKLKFQYHLQILCYESYLDQSATSGEVKITHDLSRPIRNKEILLIDGVIISGKTPHFIYKTLQSRSPKSLAFACIGIKENQIEYKLPKVFFLFDFSNQWVEGYGIGTGAFKNKKNLYNLQ